MAATHLRTLSPLQLRPGEPSYHISYLLYVLDLRSKEYTVGTVSHASLQVSLYSMRCLVSIMNPDSCLLTILNGSHEVYNLL